MENQRLKKDENFKSLLISSEGNTEIKIDKKTPKIQNKVQYKITNIKR